MEHVLVVGCGFLGKELARRLCATGRKVTAIVKSEESLRSLQFEGLSAYRIDLDITAKLPEAIAAPDAVALLLPPGTLLADGQFTALNATKNLIEALKLTQLRRAVMVSSTSVYGDMHGKSVSADTPAQPDDIRGQALHAIETQWSKACFPTRVLRLAGLYGPGRIIGLQRLRNGLPIMGPQDSLLNLIEVSDAASLLALMLDADGAADIELGSDGHPVTRLEYYSYLGARLGVTVRFEDDTNPTAKVRGSHRGSKACDNSLTRRRTGWTLQYPNFKLGVEAAFANLS